MVQPVVSRAWWEAHRDAVVLADVRRDVGGSRAADTRLAAAGVTGQAPVVSSCGSGVTACHTLIVMEHLGLPPGRLYPGSRSQYAADPDRSVELDPDRR